ncbi:MAG: TIGR03087 family PEP-CTERM/XrtA system glycosyltransferase [Planctomycetes bacterium]|nr:TIGR03087 family PEP-CTERM/XrtA system glycosyltransferase [Planctomycetota bacterium]
MHEPSGAAPAVPAPLRGPRVVFLCQRVPWPPDRGDRITTWHFLQHLLARGADVHLGCFREEERDAEGIAFLAGRCREVVAPRLSRRWRRWTSLRGLGTGEALTLPFFRHHALRAAVARWARTAPVDLVYVYSSSMAQYALAAPARAKVMQFAELDSDKWRQFAADSGPLGRWIYGREAVRLLAFEDRVARTFSRSLVVSEVERELFTARIPGVVPDVLPNGVDVAHFASAGDGERHPHTAIFTGVMDYAPNVDAVCWFAERCWPTLRAGFADARLLVVGSRPTARVRALARLPGVTVTGRVESTPPWFDRAAVGIAPLRLARGVQNKVLEAMSMGLPVVASPPAAQGLGQVPTGTLLVADGEAATIAAVAALFADPTAARRQGAAAAAFVRREFGWERMYARLDALLAELGVPFADQP